MHKYFLIQAILILFISQALKATKPKEIVILGFNDFHGSFLPKIEKIKHGKTVTLLERGGAAAFSGHIKILRKKYGKNLIIADAGDSIHGTLESNLKEGSEVIKLYNNLGVDIATIGNHEFDFGAAGSKDTKGDTLSALKARLNEANFPFIAANIKEKKTGKLLKLPNTSPHFIIEREGIKIGFIGLTTVDTAVTTRTEFVTHLEFPSLIKATEREAALLRQKGVHAVIVLAHVGIKCEIHDKGPLFPVRQIKAPSDEIKKCDPKEELISYMKKLKPGIVDAVISGHSHQVVNHFIKGIPVIQSGAHARYYNMIHLKFDPKTKKLLKDKIRTDGPIPVCLKVEEKSLDCNKRKFSKKQKEIKIQKAELFGHKIRAMDSVKKQLEKIRSYTERLKKRPIIKADREIIHDRNKESDLGNLIADAYRAKTGSDFAIMNPGGIRDNIEPGEITYGKIYKILPFDNQVSLLKISGKELRQILFTAHSFGGYYSVSGLKVILNRNKKEAREIDLNKNGKIESWERSEFIDVFKSDGSKIIDTETYTLSTIDFLVNGGDNLGWAMSQINRKKIVLNAAGQMRDVFIEHLKKLGKLDEKSHKRPDQKKPRLVFK